MRNSLVFFFRYFVLLTSFTSCEFFEPNTLVGISFSEGSPYAQAFSPTGTLEVWTEGTQPSQKHQLAFGDALELHLPRTGAGILLWNLPTTGGGQTLGAVWNFPPENLILDSQVGWVCDALALCAEKGAPIHTWNLEKIASEFRRKCSSHPAVFWDNPTFAADILAGREGPGLFRSARTRILDVFFPEGSWLYHEIGLPPSGTGEWPLGTWNFTNHDSGAPMKIMIPDSGPALVLVDTSALLTYY